jgi:hypothetical protein
MSNPSTSFTPLAPGTEIANGAKITLKSGASQVCNTYWGCKIDNSGELVGKDMPTGTIVGIAGGVVAAMLLGVGFIAYNNKSNGKTSTSSGGRRTRRHHRSGTHKN